jgi:hypothetical protein
VVWATLAGSPSVPVRDALARRLAVSLRELDALVTDARAVSIAHRPPLVRPVAPPPIADDAAASPPPARPRAPRAQDTDQLGLDF